MSLGGLGGVAYFSIEWILLKASSRALAFLRWSTVISCLVTTRSECYNNYLTSRSIRGCPRQNNLILKWWQGSEFWSLINTTKFINILGNSVSDYCDDVSHHTWWCSCSRRFTGGEYCVHRTRFETRILNSNDTAVRGPLQLLFLEWMLCTTRQDSLCTYALILQYRAQ